MKIRHTRAQKSQVLMEKYCVALFDNFISLLLLLLLQCVEKSAPAEEEQTRWGTIVYKGILEKIIEIKHLKFVSEMQFSVKKLNCCNILY